MQLIFAKQLNLYMYYFFLPLLLTITFFLITLSVIPLRELNVLEFQLLLM